MNRFYERNFGLIEEVGVVEIEHNGKKIEIQFTNDLLLQTKLDWDVMEKFIDNKHQETIFESLAEGLTKIKEGFRKKIYRIKNFMLDNRVYNFFWRITHREEYKRIEASVYKETNASDVEFGYLGFLEYTELPEETHKQIEQIIRNKKQQLFGSK